MFANRVEGEKYTASIHAGFSAHEERERIKRMQAQYKHTPKRMLTYLDGPSPMVRKAFVFQGEAVVRREIDYLFQHCSAITQLTPDDLLDKLDFQQNNIEKEEWFPALFAVMRTIMWLHEPLGFEKITPLRNKKKKPEADLKATRHGVAYAIEVYRTKEYKPLDHNFELAEIIAEKYDYDGHEDKEGKKRQTRATMKNHTCSREIFVVAFDSCSCKGYPKKDLQNAAKYALAKMIGFPDKTHIFIFTGSKMDEPSKEDECWAIEPALPD
jgi:hypothetical protein